MITSGIRSLDYCIPASDWGGRESATDLSTGSSPVSAALRENIPRLSTAGVP